MTRMHSFIIALALVAASPASEHAAANAHRAELPATAIPYTYYVSTASVSAEQQKCLDAAMRFIMPSLSLKPLVDDQIPQQVTDTLYCIDTRNYGWEKTLPKLLLENYPYGIYGKQSLVIRADWFIPFATDCGESGAYYDLLFGQRFKTRDEFVKFLKIESDPQYAFGMIEGQSGVIVQKKRWIESRPIPRGYAWLTRDSAKITNESDPLEHADGSFKHDAEEWIIGVPKVASSTGARGVLQVYFLSNGKGVTQDKAPANIATDHTKVRYGSAEIRNGISCIACHTNGLNQPTVNEFRRLIESGVDVYAKKGVQQQLEAFHLTDISKELARNNEDFCGIVEHCTLMPAEEAVQCFIKSVQAYDADVSLKQAALELGCEAKELTLALAYGSNYGGYPARLNELAHGTPLPRSLWEEYYLTAYYALRDWRDK